MLISAVTDFAKMKRIGFYRHTKDGRDGCLEILDICKRNNFKRLFEVVAQGYGYINIFQVLVEVSR